MSSIEPSAPASLNAIRAQVSFKRWRLYEIVRQILAEIEIRIDWEKLYDVEAGLEDLVAWGLFLEDALAAMTPRLRGAFADKEPAGARVEPRAEELEDHLWWGARQIEGSLRQSLSVLSREIVGLLTGGARNLSDDDAFDKKRDLAMPIAEVAGKMRSDLRKFTAFLVADGFWDPDDVELLLFPEKREELTRGRDLKQLDVSWWRKQIGLVGQQPMLFDLTLEDLFLRFWLQKCGKGGTVFVAIQSPFEHRNML